MGVPPLITPPNPITANTDFRYDGLFQSMALVLLQRILDASGGGSGGGGATATQSFSLEWNTSLLISASNSQRKKVTIRNEGFRDMYISYVDPAVVNTFDPIAPGEFREEKVYTGDIRLIWAYNASGNPSTETVSITGAAAIDLTALYLVLKNETVTNPTFPALTTGTNVTPGVYSQAAAVTPTGIITLDGLNQANPVFVFVVTGALTVSANVQFILTNGATANNVFWVSDGAISLGTNSDCFGTFISLVANSVGNNATLTGRAFSLGGAVANRGDITTPSTGSQYTLGYLESFVLFTSAGALSNSGANSITGDVGTNLGAITGFAAATITGNIYNNTSTITIPLVGGRARIIEITT